MRLCSVNFANCSKTTSIGHSGANPKASRIADLATDFLALRARTLLYTTAKHRGPRLGLSAAMERARGADYQEAQGKAPARSLQLTCKTNHHSVDFGDWTDFSARNGLLVKKKAPLSHQNGWTKFVQNRGSGLSALDNPVQSLNTTERSGRGPA